MTHEISEPVRLVLEPAARPVECRLHDDRAVVAATIGGLETHEGYVAPDTVVEKVIARLKTHPELPGVILTLPGAWKGMVSRSKCLELLSSPYGNALFLRRSILNLYDELALTPTVLPARMRIDQAVVVALGRPVDQRYEPILVDFGARHLRLLDLHVLLLAQSRMLENANRLIQQQVDIERALSSTLELDEVLQLILRYLEDMVPYDRAGVLLEQDDVLRFAATRGFADRAAVRRFAIAATQSAVYQRICTEQRPLTSEKLASMAEELDKGVQRMQIIVNTMLDVANIDQEIVSLRYAPTNLAYLLTAFYNELAQRHALQHVNRLRIFGRMQRRRRRGKP